MVYPILEPTHTQDVYSPDLCFCNSEFGKGSTWTDTQQEGGVHSLAESNEHITARSDFPAHTYETLEALETRCDSSNTDACMN